MVLLIDDSRIDLKVNRTILEKGGVEAPILTFDLPEQGLDWILDHRSKLPNLLVLLDINMPLINGFQLIDTIQRHDPHLLDHVMLYLLTSSNDSEDYIKASQYTCIKGLIQKPLNLEKLKKLMHTHAKPQHNPFIG
ncbi:MAG TPA: response regulator [Luteibaculaceae bacterium]|jgi:response regulator RpfG family c-di-GMP phosphodiesterase|nr:response regulator [Luteibaculaceae bacterium]